MSHMLTKFWKKSKSASPFCDHGPSNFKSGDGEQSPEAHPHVKMDDPAESVVGHAVTTDGRLITPEPLTSPNPSPTFSDAREISHEQLEDTKSDLILQAPDHSHLAEHDESDMNEFDETQNGQQAKVEGLLSDSDTLPPLQLTTSTATLGAEPSDLRDNTATPQPQSSQSYTDPVQTTDCNEPHPSTNPATLDLQMTEFLPSGEVPDAAAQTLTTSRSSPTHNVDSGEASTPKCPKASRGLSEPPEVCSSIQSVGSSARLGKKNGVGATAVTPGNMPLHVQMLNQLQGWAVHIGQNADAKRRQQMIDAMSRTMEMVWVYAMRMGQINFDWADDVRGLAEAGRTDIDVDILALEEQDITEQDIMQHGGYPRGRAVEKDKSKRKRAVSPAREVVIDTGVHKGSKAYGITAGELYESGVSMQTIQIRVQAHKLDDEDALLTDTLEDLDQTEMNVSNWKGVVPRTAYNILGRDLKLYCLWEMQKSRSDLELLQGLLGTFRQANQIRNTENRIKAEQELHDQLLALALELDLQENGGVDPRESIPQVGSDVGQAADPFLISNADGDEIEQQPEPTIEEDFQTLHDSTVVDQASYQDTETRISSQTQGGAVADEERAIADIDSHAATTQINQQMVESGPSTNVESILKRAAEDNQPTSEPPAKKQRREIEDDNVDLPDTRPDSATPSSATSSIPPETSMRQRAYVRFILRPKANQYLLRASRPLVAESAPWPDIRDALKAAGIHAGIRNVLVKDYKECIDNWDIPVTEEDGVLEIDDIVGYPTRKEIFNSLKPEGVTGNDLKELFAGRVNFLDTKWQTLVHSVGYYDRAAGRWYRKDELADKLRHRRIVSLKVHNHKGFKPEDYSSRTVNNTQGFRWRYVSTSTVAQRYVIDEAIDAFVKHTKEGYQTTNPAAIQLPMKYRYHGKYEMLINPGDYVKSDYPDRQADFQPPPAIVHGIWDFRGRKNENNKVHGMEWFYEGKDGEVLDKWVVRHERLEDGTSQGPPPAHEKIVDGSWKRVVEKEIEGMRTEDQVSGKHLRVDGSKHVRQMQSKGAKKIRLNVNSMVAGTGLDGAITPGRGTGGRRGTATSGAKGTGGGRGKKGKVPAAPRPMRSSRAKVVRYAEDEVDDSDGTWNGD